MYCRLLNVFICHPGPCHHSLGPVRGSCCVKITKNCSKSTFLKPFDLVMTGNFFYFFIFIWNTYSRLFIQRFICHSGPCDHFLDPFRGLCCVKITKNSSNQHFLNCLTQSWLETLFTFYFCMKYVLSIVSLMFSFVTSTHVTLILTLSGGCVMSKWPISIFLAPLDILSSRHCRETPASLACLY